MKRLIVVAVALLLAAPADAQLFGKSRKEAHAEWVAQLPPEGDAPTPDYVQRAALAYMETTLKDAESARYQWGAITQGVAKGAFEKYGTPGWIADVHVNAKNSYGGYTGYTPWKVVFRSGYIVEAYRYDTRMKDWVPTIGMKGTPVPPVE